MIRTLQSLCSVRSRFLFTILCVPLCPFLSLTPFVPSLLMVALCLDRLIYDSYMFVITYCCVSHFVTPMYINQSTFVLGSQTWLRCNLATLPLPLLGGNRLSYLVNHRPQTLTGRTLPLKSLQLYCYVLPLGLPCRARDREIPE